MLRIDGSLVCPKEWLKKASEISTDNNGISIRWINAWHVALFAYIRAKTKIISTDFNGQPFV